MRKSAGFTMEKHQEKNMKLEKARGIHIESSTNLLVVSTIHVFCRTSIRVLVGYFLEKIGILQACQTSQE